MMKNSALEFYRNALTKVTLPASGLVVQVRKFSSFDYLHIGQLPDAFAKGEAEEAVRKGNQTKLTEIAIKNAEFMERFSKIACTRCVVSKAIRIVDKFPDDLTGSEVAYSQLPPEDVQAIVEAVQKASGMTQEVAEAARPFPQEPEPVADAGRSGTEVSLPTERTDG